MRLKPELLTPQTVLRQSQGRHRPSVRPTPEPLTLHRRLLHDVCSLALLALIVIPFYLLLNQYWKSLVLLLVLYSLLALFFLRLGWYIRRVMRREPAEIPPWHTLPRTATSPAENQPHFGVGEALVHVMRDPLYCQEVLKPRLRQLLAYRLSGSPDIPFEALGEERRARIDPALLDFLTGREATGLWARFCYRKRRLRHLLEALRRLEAI